MALGATLQLDGRRDDPDHVVASLARPGQRGVRTVRIPQIGGYRVLHIRKGNQSAAVEKQTAGTDARYRCHIVTDKQHGASLRIRHLLYLTQTALLKFDITDSQ